MVIINWPVESFIISWFLESTPKKLDAVEGEGKEDPLDFIFSHFDLKMYDVQKNKFSKITISKIIRYNVRSGAKMIVFSKQKKD